MEEIYKKFECGKPTVLEEVCRIYNDSHYIGITLNLPRSKKFKRMTSIQQKTLLSKIFTYGLTRMEKYGIGHYKLVYEYCSDGVLHMHGLLRCDLTNHKVGIIQDLAKRIHREIKDQMKINAIDGKYHPDYIRYTSPSVLTQYMNGPEELLRWLIYMHKDQVVTLPAVADKETKMDE